ncbi:MAG TPA: hypothetical protein VIM11_11365 [Tepidisphaeraceae bacterium]|jgi:hypothetical protein
MSHASNEHDEPGGLRCPNCAGAVGSASPEGLAECPHCREQFLVMNAEPEPDVGSPSRASETDRAEHDVELSGLHIQNISNLRRGAYRSRSYLIIAAGVCIVAAAKLIQIAVLAWRAQLRLASIGDAIAAVVAIMFFASTARKIAALTREIRQSRLEDPAAPPDFSMLGDGSQRLRDLEAMAGLEPGPASQKKIATTEAQRHGGALDGLE